MLSFFEDIYNYSEESKRNFSAIEFKFSSKHLFYSEKSKILSVHSTLIFWRHQQENKVKKNKKRLKF